MNHYVRVGKDPTYWFVKDGRRTGVSSPAQMYEFGLWPTIRVTQEELEAIPFADAPDQDSLSIDQDSLSIDQELQDDAAPKAEEEPEDG